MQLKLLAKSHHVDNIWTFVFEPSQTVDYEAGQYVRVRLDHKNPDDKGPKRFFTTSAPPYKGVLQITTRITDSSFKQSLNNLEIGDDTVEMINSPEGDFLWKDSKRPLVFVAAGIGVTPYNAILKERIHANKPIPVTLLYNGRDDALPWKEEFNALEKSNPEFKVVYQIGERISTDSLNQTFPALNESIVYLSGPEQMVEEVGEALKENGLPEDQLMQDWFPNYDDSSY